VIGCSLTFHVYIIEIT